MLYRFKCSGSSGKYYQRGESTGEKLSGGVGNYSWRLLVWLWALSVYQLTYQISRVVRAVILHSVFLSRACLHCSHSALHLVAATVPTFLLSTSPPPRSHISPYSWPLNINVKTHAGDVRLGSTLASFVSLSLVVAGINLRGKFGEEGGECPTYIPTRTSYSHVFMFLSVFLVHVTRYCD